MSHDISAVPGAVSTELLRTVLPTVSHRIREAVDSPAASSLARVAPTQRASRQHDLSFSREPQFDPAPAADGCIGGAPTVFRNVRSFLPPESQTP